MTRYRLIAATAGLVATLFAALAMYLVFVGASYEPNTQIPAGFRGHQVRVQGVPLRVLQRGEGRDVLLLHGSPGSIEDWSPIVGALAGEYRVTAFDRPGHGFSGDTGHYSLEHNAQLALALLRSLQLSDVIVVGHSYGGATALALALTAPKDVAAYVIVDSATYKPAREPNLTFRALTLPLLGRGLAAAAGRRQAAEMIRKGIFAQWPGRSPSEDFIALRTRIWSAPKVTHAIARETLGYADDLAQQSPRYPSISAPVQIVVQADDALRRSAAERLHSEVAGSTLQLLSGTGHYVQFEKPAEVVAAIRRAAQATAKR